MNATRFPRATRGPGLVRGSAIAFGMLAVVAWVQVLAGGDSGVGDLFRGDTWARAGEFAGELIGIGTDSAPAFLDGTSWRHAIGLSVETLAMSVLAAGMAGTAALASFLPAARNVAYGELGGQRRAIGVPGFVALRVLFAFTRGVPELVWALLIVFVFSPGVLAGALALAVHNYGILGKLAAEVVENMDTRPARALRGAGASNFQVVVYGVLPQALPQLLTYLLYRWEVIIRTTVVVGFVAAGGLGREFRLQMSYLHYDDVALLLICYLALVVGVDLASAGLRRLAR